MNRRNFFKVVTGFVVGIFAAKKSKADVTIFPTEEQAMKVSRDIYGDPDKLYCRGKNGTLCPRCKFNYPELSTAFKKRSGTRLATKEEIMEFLEITYTGNYPAYIVRPNDIEFIHYKDFYKTKFS